MTAERAAALRLTVLGAASAAPSPASPASGFLVEHGDTAILLDAGQGVVRRLAAIRDPLSLAGVIVGHMHADHYLDLAGLRYLFPWGSVAPTRLPVHLPPGGRSRLDELASAISERPGFFDDAYAIEEYDPGRPLRIGSLTVRFLRARHYVPAWAAGIETPDGARLVYTGDTGPSDAVVGFARGADLLLVEAALRSAADDDMERGHLTAPEAIDLAVAAGVRSALLVHYPPDLLDAVDARCRAAGQWIGPAVAGLVRTVDPRRAPVTTPEA